MGVGRILPWIGASSHKGDGGGVIFSILWPIRSEQSVKACRVKAGSAEVVDKSLPCEDAGGVGGDGCVAAVFRAARNNISVVLSWPYRAVCLYLTEARIARGDSRRAVCHHSVSSCPS